MLFVRTTEGIRWLRRRLYKGLPFFYPTATTWGRQTHRIGTAELMMTRILRSNGTLAWLVSCGLGLVPLAAADGVGPSQGDFYVIPGLSVYKAPDSEGHEAGAIPGAGAGARRRLMRLHQVLGP